MAPLPRMPARAPRTASRNQVTPRLTLPVVEDQGRSPEAFGYDWEPDRNTKDFYRQWFQKELNSTSAISRTVMLAAEKPELKGTMHDPSLRHYLNRSPLAPVFFYFAVFGFLPVSYRVPSNHPVKSSLIYCVTVYVLVAVCIWNLLNDRMTHFKPDQVVSMEARLLSFEMILNLVTFLLVPCLWLNANEMSEKPLEQALFEKHYHTVVGQEFDWGTLTPKAWIISTTIFLLVPVVFFSAYFTLPDLELKLYYAPAYIYTNVFNVQLAVAIFCRAKFLRYSATQLRIQFDQMGKQRNITKADIRNMRELWTELRDLFEDKISFMPLLPVMHLLYIFCMSTVTTFEFLSFLASNSINLASAQLCFAATYVFELGMVCNASHLAREEMQSSFLKELEKLTSRDLTKDALAELHFFYNVMMSRPAGIIVAGFVKVDRSLVATMLSTMVTYLIVLVQFQMSDKKSLPPQSNSTLPV